MEPEEGSPLSEHQTEDTSRDGDGARNRTLKARRAVVGRRGSLGGGAAAGATAGLRGTRRGRSRGSRGVGGRGRRVRVGRALGLDLKVV